MTTESYREAIQHQLSAIETTLAIPGLDDITRVGLETKLRQLQSELLALPNGQHHAHSNGGHMDSYSTIIGSVNGDVVSGSKIILQFLSDFRDVSKGALQSYLGELIRECRRLPLADVDDLDPQQRQIPLEAVYTRLEVASALPMHDHHLSRHRPWESSRQMTALEAVTRHGRVVLLGQPGSGKSTFINYLALTLAQACLGDEEALANLGETWTAGPLLPIRVLLREFAVWITTADESLTPGALIWAFLRAQYQDAALVEGLRERAMQGRAVLLLDGLDEVIAGDHGPLSRVREVVDALAAANVRPIIVTCRTLDYQHAGRALGGWPVETILPFSNALRQEFIARWYDVVARLGRPTNGDPEELRIGLQSEVRARPELRRLAGNPLLLTMMAHLHAFRGRLPEERVRLYAECIDLLLYRWRPNPGQRSLDEVLGIPQWTETDTNRLLDRLGFVAHRQGTLRDDEHGAGADLPRKVLLETAAEFFAPFGSDRDFERAQRFCTYVTQHSNGVLQQFGPDTFRFPHRTFQEFLAARRLLSDEDWENEQTDVVSWVLELSDLPQWHEVLLLAVGQLVVVAGRTRDAAAVAEALLDRHEPGSGSWARDVILAAEVIGEIGQERLRRLGRLSRLWDDAAAALARLLTADWRLLDSLQRPRAAAALGELGDPRPGVCTLEPDWVKIPAGPFLIGSAEGDHDGAPPERPQRTVKLAAYRIARYPVTNAQWRRFVEAGGYQCERWWSESGWQWRQRERWRAPRWWHDQRFNGENQPVVGISWYEAQAFCTWMSEQLGYPVALPNEAQWEKAARSEDGRRYPWGDAWDPTRSNTNERGPGRPAPVGCYPDGASVYGVLDMSGNICEWTATPWSDSYTEHDGTTSAEGAHVFVWRGGSWASERQSARCAFRDVSIPNSRSNLLGLRLVSPVPKARKKAPEVEKAQQPPESQS